MITPTDKDYKATKLIMQGKMAMDNEFDALAYWIHKTYKVRPINIIHEMMSGPGGKLMPRLQIIFEYKVNEAIFYDNPASRLNYNKAKQAQIKEQFKKSLTAQRFTLKRFLRDLFGRYNTEDLFVIFSSFEPVAKMEANESVTPAEIEQLIKEIGNPHLWKIMNAFTSAFFFFYTNGQLKAHADDGYKQLLADKYFEMLKPHDEFGYFKRNEFSVILDSKENFYNNYQSNWYYYFK
jgi:hypothetical protein